jgi:spore cortex formation protein SpoVR/YcgB (stage V sporulation)
MKKEEVRSVVPEKPEDSHDIRGPYTDFFCNASLFVYYTDENGGCDSIEFTQPTIAIFEGKPLNGVPYVEAINWLRKFDSELEVEEYVGATSYKLGIGLYAPDYDEKLEPNAKVEAVIVFVRGYYDVP